MKTIVSELAEAIYSYDEIYEWVVACDMDPSDEEFDHFELFDGDPDKLKCNGTEIFFMEKEVNDVKYILTSEEPNEEQTKMLTEFFDENFRDSFSDDNGSTWKAYNDAENAIAYRGGSGYFYGIWVYTKK